MAISIWSVAPGQTAKTVSYLTTPSQSVGKGLGDRLGRMTVSAVRDFTPGSGSSGPTPPPTTLQIWPRV